MKLIYAKKLLRHLHELTLQEDEGWNNAINYIIDHIEREQIEVADLTEAQFHQLFDVIFDAIDDCFEEHIDSWRDHIMAEVLKQTYEIMRGKKQGGENDN